jgi:hypothetical protein
MKFQIWVDKQAMASSRAAPRPWNFHASPFPLPGDVKPVIPESLFHKKLVNALFHGVASKTRNVEGGRWIRGYGKDAGRAAPTDRPPPDPGPDPGVDLPSWFRSVARFFKVLLM